MNVRSTLLITLTLGMLPLYGQKTESSAHHHHILAPSTKADNNTQPVGITPPLMRTLYSNTGDTPSETCGQGQIIGIVDAYDDPTIESDLGVFNSQFDLGSCTSAEGCFRKMYSTGKKPASNASWSTEIALDVEWAHAMAPCAAILLVEAPSSSTNDLLTAVQVAVTNGATVVSMSWGTAEYAGETSADGIFQAGVRGKYVSFVAAAGDSGHGVEYPAASPFVVGVGGTTITYDAYGNLTNQVAWDSSTGATGGGLSIFEAEPEWQGGFQNMGRRGVPDVAFDADPATGVAVFSSQMEAGQKGWMQVGGTSVGAPNISAVIAMVNSQRAWDDGSRTPIIMPAAIYTNTGIWSDVTAGKNGMCGVLCTAVPGYDFTTGLGTPISNWVINTLSGWCE